MKFDTKLLHAGHNPKEHQMCINVPIYPTTAFDFDSVERGAGLFDLKVAGDIYTRLSNPTPQFKCISSRTSQGPNIEFWVEMSKEHHVREVVGSMSHRSFRRAHGKAMRMGKRARDLPDAGV